jgi:hypothetical protein
MMLNTGFSTVPSASVALLIFGGCKKGFSTKVRAREKKLGGVVGSLRRICFGPAISCSGKATVGNDAAVLSNSVTRTEGP